MDTSTTSKQEPEYVHVPALKIFTLGGLWALDDEAVLEVLCSKVMPNVYRLSMDDGCDGFSLAEWIKSTSSHLHQLWGHRVLLESLMKSKKTLLSFGDHGFDAKLMR